MVKIPPEVLSVNITGMVIFHLDSYEIHTLPDIGLYSRMLPVICSTFVVRFHFTKPISKIYGEKPSIIICPRVLNVVGIHLAVESPMTI